MNSTHLGLLAGAITSLATIPQVAKAYRTRRVRDISIWQPVLLDAGTGLWFVYGILIHDVPLIVANAFSVVCNSLLIVMKILYRDSDNEQTNDYISE